MSEARIERSAEGETLGLNSAAEGGEGVARHVAGMKTHNSLEPHGVSFPE